MKQIHAGENLHGNSPICSLWHSRDGKTYWSGSWGNRTARQLFMECASIMADLRRNHPELLKEAEAEEDSSDD